MQFASILISFIWTALKRRNAHHANAHRHMLLSLWESAHACGVSMTLKRRRILMFSIREACKCFLWCYVQKQEYLVLDLKDYSRDCDSFGLWGVRVDGCCSNSVSRSLEEWSVTSEPLTMRLTWCWRRFIYKLYFRKCLNSELANVLWSCYSCTHAFR